MSAATSLQPKKSPQLKNFRWKGVNSSGKRVSGQTLAITELEVRSALATQHIQVKKIKKSIASVLDRMSHKVKGKDITMLTPCCSPGCH